MKKLLYFTGCIAASTFLIGFLFRMLKWQGGDIVYSVSNVFLLVSMLLLSAIAYRTFKFLKTSEKLRTFSGISGGFLLACGLLFKIFHFPGANIMILCGLLFLSLLFVPLFFWQLYKNEVSSVQQN